jgi:phytoene dehydrogenase-like protein
MKPKSTQVAVIGAGIGGLTTAALLARAGYQVTVLESQTYAGGCAGTFYHQGYRFDAGATLAGGFQPDGPHDLVGNMLDIQWRVRPVEVAWEVHLPGQTIALTQSADAVVKAFPQSEPFWTEQQGVADMCWSMAAQGLPFPPTSLAEMGQLFQVGLAYFPQDLRLTRYAFSSVNQWLTRHHLQHDVAFKRFVDAQLLISAQATSDNVNSLYGATALDLPRQGVQHVERCIGGIA